MADLKLAAQTALIGALEAALEVPVFQHVPAETQPPYVLLDEMSSEPAGPKGGGFDRIDFSIVSAVRAAGREFLTPTMTAIRGAIEGANLAATGVVLSRPQFQSEEDGLAEDGETYVGTQRFSLFAQEA